MGYEELWCEAHAVERPDVRSPLSGTRLIVSTQTMCMYVFFQWCHQYCMAKLFAENRKATLKQKCSPD